MLPLLLAAVIAQSPQVPQIFVPGAAYDAEVLAPALGKEFTLTCQDGDRRVPLQALGSEHDAVRRVPQAPCEADLLVRGASTVRPATVRRTDADAGIAEEAELAIGAQRWMLLTTPFSDGGVRVVLRSPDGAEITVYTSAAPGAESRLLWAGDLNDDGALDLVLESTEGLTTFQQLFLSDAAGLPVLVNETVLYDSWRAS